MSTAATQQQPVIPPRPSRSHDMPKIPPRPINRHLDRSVSPGQDRFAPSPLNDHLKSPRASHLSPHHGHAQVADPIARSTSVDLPSVGEEGMEYAAVAEELSDSRGQSTSPEQTRSVGEDIKLHAPKPSLPAVSAKQRVAMVTRTDSDRAASFGIGRPSFDEQNTPSNRSLKKKASTISQASAAESHPEDEHGIPEIGIQVPMYPNAGDVQAPSPAPTSANHDGAKKHHAHNHNNNNNNNNHNHHHHNHHHKRRSSSRGFGDLPPGSYGLHGHGVVSTDKLGKAYYEKHPEAAKLEHHQYQHDRPHDFSMSSEDLNKIVHSTHGRGAGHGTRDLAGTPSEQMGWQAIEESASRVASPRPASTAPKSERNMTSPLKQNFHPEISGARSEDDHDNGIIHVDHPQRRGSAATGGEGSAQEQDAEYHAPILAEDELAKAPSHYDHQPAVEPSERRHSAFELGNHSRPSSRPTSLYKEYSHDDHHSTPLEDVREYEPLFPEEEKAARKEAARKLEQNKQRFPSRDIWEDAPNSVHYTAEVSTPEVPPDHKSTNTRAGVDLSEQVTPRDGETPAQAFARRQEELAEKESAGDPESFIHRKAAKPVQPWAHQSHLTKEVAAHRPASTHRFPSQDIWEDTPTSLQLQTTVSTPQREELSSATEEKKVEMPQRPAKKNSESSSASSDKPAVPQRPKPKHVPSDEHVTKPTVPDRPKPQVPVRPAKKLSGSDSSKEAPEPRAKPAVPARPMGGKIAALQAGFISDLNKKLGLGPQAPKKDEPAPAEEVVEEQEKAPLSDARKGRARGPQRRAPKAAISPTSSAREKAAPGPAFSFSTTTVLFSIDPDDGDMSIASIAKEPIDHMGARQLADEAPSTLKEQTDDEDRQVESLVEEPPKSVEGASKESTPPTEAITEAVEEKDSPDAAKKTETETLASNMAGETIVDANVEKDTERGTIEPVEVEDAAQSS